MWGVDIAEEMVALARRSHPQIRFRQADAEHLPFPNGSFDAIVGNLVINHLPDPDLAIREFARVMAPGGRIALSTWDLPELNRFIGIVVDALDACGVTRPPGTLAGPDPYRFADDGEFGELLAGAGFEDVEVQPVQLTHRLSNADELWQGILGGSVRTAGLVMQQAPGTRREVRATVARLAEDYRAGEELAIPACAKIAGGRWP